MKSYLGKSLSSPRLKLRPLELTDAPAYLDIYSDAEAMKYWSDEPISTLKEARDLIQADIDMANTGAALFWALEEKKTGKVIGKFALIHYHEKNRRAEVGYVLNSQYWQKGLMTEALATVIEFSFGELGLHRLEADTDPQNEGSLALLEKLGFRQEGYFRERWFTYGKWQDSVMFGLLKKDWDIRPKLF